MTTSKLLEIVKDRGIKLSLKDGRPVLIQANGSKACTDALLAVLKIHRDRIIEILRVT